MIKKHLDELPINKVWFSRSGDSINIKRRNDGNIYTIKKHVFMKTKLGQIVAHPYYSIFLRNVLIKFDDEQIVEWYETRYVRIKDFICNISAAKKIIKSNACEFNDEVDLKFQEVFQEHREYVLQKMTFFKFIDNLELQEILSSIQKAIDDEKFLEKYINFLSSTIRRDQSEYYDDYDDYEEDYDYEHIVDFINDKLSLLGEYKIKYFTSWPLSKDWVHDFITNFWAHGYHKGCVTKLVPFTKDKNELSQFNDPKYIYVFCKKTDFTKSEKDFLLLTFYKNQSQIKLFSTNSLKDNEPQLFKSF